MTVHARDLATLRLLCRYRLLIYQPWSCAIYGGPGQSVGAAAADLEKNDYVTRHKRALPGRVTYLTPTEKTAKEITGVPLDRARPLGPVSLDQALGILWFCLMDQPVRHRLEPHEVNSLFQGTTLPPNVAHVASEELGSPCVFRVLTTRDARQTKNHIRAQLQEISKSQELQSWVRDGCYGLALLAPTRPAVQAIERQVRAGRFAAEVPLILGLGPTAETLRLAIKGK